MASLYYESEFAHHGILGMKWGQRRYQNRDGTLTPRGQKRYSREMQRAAAGQKSEQRRLALEKAKIREARKTEKARLDLQKEKAALRDAKRNAGKRQKSHDEQEREAYSHKKKISEMSNEELADMITRVSLEKKLAELSAPPKKEINPMFRDITKSLITSAGTELSKAIGASLQKAMTHDMDMQVKAAEAKKQKALWDREDKQYQQKRLDALSDAKTQREWDKMLADTRWERERQVLLSDRQFDIDNPFYVPASKRSWKSEKKKKDDDDDD